MRDAHPDRGRLLAWLDGELGPGPAAEVGGHVEDCDRCRSRAEALRAHGRLFSAASERLDRPMPEIPNPAERGPTGGSGGRSGGRPGRPRGLTPTRAAAMALLLAGGALLTPPGRAMAERALSGITGLFGGRSAERAPAAASSDTVPGRQQRSAAVGVSARNGRLTVVLLVPDSAAGPLRIRVGTGGAARVEGEMEDVERGPGELRVRAASLAGLRVTLPDSVSRAELRVNGRTVLRQRGRSVRTAVPTDTAEGGELILRPGR